MQWETRVGMTLEKAAERAGHLPMVRRQDLEVGDQIIVRTFNSSYTIRVVGANRFVVSGGWFENKGIGPYSTSINGCTWGGSAIKIDFVAACGLCIEFGNRVRTSMVRQIIVFPTGSAN